MMIVYLFACAYREISPIKSVCVSVKHSTCFISFLELLVCLVLSLIVMLIMATVTHRATKRCHFAADQPLVLPSVSSPSKRIKRTRDSQHHHHHSPQQQVIRHCRRSSCDWTSNYRKKVRRTSEKRGEEEEDDDDEERQYHCYVYLTLYPSTVKCSIDVIVKSTNAISDESDAKDSILIGRTRIGRSIKTGASSLSDISLTFSLDVLR